MSGAEWAAWAGIVVALGFGIWGVVSSSIANSRVKKANELAEAANRIAEDAIKRAETANTIAEEANKLSKDSNAIIDRTARQQVEDWLVQWEADYEPDGAIVTLRNTGRDRALNVSVLVVADALHEAAWFDEGCAAGDEIDFALPKLIDQRDSYVIEERARHKSLMAIPGVLDIENAFETLAEVVVSWRSAEDNSGQQRIKLQLS